MSVSLLGQGWTKKSNVTIQSDFMSQNNLPQHSIHLQNQAKKIFKDKPKHDWTSHGCDALRMLAVGQRLVKNYTGSSLHGQTKAITNYNVYEATERGLTAGTAYTMFQ